MACCHNKEASDVAAEKAAPAEKRRLTVEALRRLLAEAEASGQTTVEVGEAPEPEPESEPEQEVSEEPCCGGCSLTEYYQNMPWIDWEAVFGQEEETFSLILDPDDSGKEQEDVELPERTGMDYLNKLFYDRWNAMKQEAREKEEREEEDTVPKCIEYKEWMRAGPEQYGAKDYRLPTKLRPLVFKDTENLEEEREGKDPRCRPMDFYERESRTFVVKLKHVENISLFSLDFAKSMLFDSIVNSGFLDDNSVSMREFDDHLKGNLWDEWEIEGYEPEFSSQPRRELMNMSFWLIASMKKGIPDSVDQMSGLRERMTELINDTRYVLYQPWPWIRENDGYSFAKMGTCRGPFAQKLDTHPTFVDCNTCCLRLVDMDHPENNNDKKMTLSTAVTFHFKYIKVPPLVSPFSGSNHWAAMNVANICTINLDRCALVYDFFMTLAVKHFVAAQEEEDEEKAEDQRKAQNICLRMALEAAAFVADTILHETAHGISLYHCVEPGLNGEKQSCIQDMITMPWHAYTTARLGLPMISQAVDDVDPRTTVHWTEFIGSDRDIVAKTGLLLDLFVQCTNTKSVRMKWGIDYPLVMGSNLVACSVFGVMSNCSNDSNKPCYNSHADPPNEFADCTKQIMENP